MLEKGVGTHTPGIPTIPGLRRRQFIGHILYFIQHTHTQVSGGTRGRRSPRACRRAHTILYCVRLTRARAHRVFFFSARAWLAGLREIVIDRIDQPAPALGDFNWITPVYVRDTRSISILVCVRELRLSRVCGDKTSVVNTCTGGGGGDRSS